MMYFKQIDEIVAGTKTQTRRIVKENEMPLTSWTPDHITDVVIMRKNGPTTDFRLKWQVGRDYAVSPGRGKPGVWWREATKHYPPQWTEFFIDECGWNPLRIRLTAIRQEYVQDISEEDALAEGYGDWPYDPNVKHPNYFDWYRDLWQSINTRKGTRWQDNPLCWVLEFQVVK
jgi:hypothetical protein